ncbi:MAG: GNAT family N-acetyltransferase [Phycisphaerae bacterium]
MANNTKIQGVSIRSASASDIDTIVQFNAAMAQETEYKTLDTETLRAGVTRVLDGDRGAQYYVAEHEGKVIGQLMTTSEWSDWRNGYFWWIQSVFIDSQYRRQGVFSALYAHVRDQANAAEDVRGLRLYVFNANQRAIDTYRKLGMVVTDYHLCEEEF